MATIRAFTTIEQSRKLAEILPLESADMCYILHATSDNLDWRFDDDVPPMVLGGTPINKLTVKALPCWSLAALLGVLPQYITKYMKSERCQKTFHLNLFRSYYHCVSYSFTSSVREDDNTLYCIGSDNWVDACYKMILKLNELNLL